MSTQMHDEVSWWEVIWPPRLFRVKKQQKSQVQLNLNVFNDVNKRERANMLDKKQRRQILLEKKHENWW